MYKVLLVDDEHWELLGLEKSFQWEKHGFTVAAKTTDSEEALQILSSLRPEVVFTDIRMPIVSGLQLLQHARKMNMDTEFVIISGYSEFSYAQEALRQGAFDYKLKPIELEETDELLERLASHLDRKNMSRDLELLEKLSEDKLYVDGLFASKGLKSSEPYYQGLMFEASSREALLQLQGVFAAHTAVIFSIGPGKLLCILNTPEDLSGFTKASYARLTLDCYGSIGLSRLHRSPADLGILYREACLAARSTFLKKSNDVFTYPAGKNPSIHHYARELAALVEMGQLVQAAHRLSDMRKDFEAGSMNLRDFFTFWSQFHTLTAGKSPHILAESEFDTDDCEYFLSAYKTIDVFLTALADFILARAEVSDAVGLRGKPAFQELLAYIEDRYDTELSLHELSQKFHYNENYFCELFRKNTGKTFSQYITDIRMQKAAHLLNQGSFSLSDICIRVGYKDYFYFIKAFKKYHGVPPAQYRKIARGGDGACE